MTALSPAERARRYRANRRGGPPRKLSDAPLARAKRRIRKGATVAELDPAEAEALRAYHRAYQRDQRAQTKDHDMTDNPARDPLAQPGPDRSDEITNPALYRFSGIYLVDPRRIVERDRAGANRLTHAAARLATYLARREAVSAGYEPVALVGVETTTAEHAYLDRAAIRATITAHKVTP